MTEFELIASLTKGAPKKGRDIVCGVGDDAAVIQGIGKNVRLVTTDALIEGVHFLREWMSLKNLGRKALAVNLSDIAAMGGNPRFHLVSIGLPPKNSANIAKEIYRGMDLIAREFKSVLIGGDTVGSPLGIVISVTAIGECPGKRCILRSTARPGDAIYVTGTLGSSALGLYCLKRGLKSGFVKRHIEPIPRILEGQIIAKTGLATSMIDSSDGLMADVGHIASASGVGFEIDAGLVPMDEGFGTSAENMGLDPVLLAASGGEDYELIFTVKASSCGDFERSVCSSGLFKITKIGRILKNHSRCILLDKSGKEIKLPSPGFDHFV